jgi:hypothetical protein
LPAAASVFFIEFVAGRWLESTLLVELARTDYEWERSTRKRAGKEIG